MKRGGSRRISPSCRSYWARLDARAALCSRITVLFRLLGLGQQEPKSGQREPRPSVFAIVADVCLAKAFSYFDATIAVFGHRAASLPTQSLPNRFFFVAFHLPVMSVTAPGQSACYPRLRLI